jgi:hypothetical protein
MPWQDQLSWLADTSPLAIQPSEIKKVKTEISTFADFSQRLPALRMA